MKYNYLTAYVAWQSAKRVVNEKQSGHMTPRCAHVNML